MMLGFSDYREGAMRIAALLGVPYAEIVLHTFPDGETRVTLPSKLPERVAICRTLNDPNEKLIQLMLAAKSSRLLGVKHLTLIAPYLCYMRQDKAFHAGEAVSQVIIGEWLAQQFDTVITVDPHLHRIHALSEAIPASSAIALSAAKLMGHFVRAQNNSAILLGPDEESRQWVSVAAEAAGCQFGVCRKVRHGDRETTIQLPDVAIKGQHLILIDDIASSGGTLISAARACVSSGAKKIDVLVVHALFRDDIGRQLHDAGVSNIWSSDSVVHPSNVLSLAPLIAAGLYVR